MTEQEPNSPNAILVAIDVSKLRNDVLIEIAGKTRRRRFVVPNTKAEHDRFVELLLGLGKPVIAGFEATGQPGEDGKPFGRDFSAQTVQDPLAAILRITVGLTHIMQFPSLDIVCGQLIINRQRWHDATTPISFRRMPRARRPFNRQGHPSAPAEHSA